MTLDDWALRWNVPPAALADLRGRLGLEPGPTHTVPPGRSERAVQAQVRVEASEKHNRLWRNNVGATPAQCPDCGARRRPVRYGLCNESHQQNKRVKSSDLIGIRPVLIEPWHVGHILGQFVAREAKPEGWQYAGDEHERAQLAFLNMVLALGGDAAFANTVGTLAHGVPVAIDLRGQ